MTKQEEIREGIAALNNQHGKYNGAPRCGKCGGRLFLESEHSGKKVRPYWECSVGCGQRFDELGGDKSYRVGVLPGLQIGMRLAKGNALL